MVSASSSILTLRPASGAALEYVTVMQQPVEHRADRSNIAEQLAPVFSNGSDASCR
jgi:hypothetical protein